MYRYRVTGKMFSGSSIRGLINGFHGRLYSYRISLTASCARKTFSSRQNVCNSHLSWYRPARWNVRSFSSTGGGGNDEGEDKEKEDSEKQEDGSTEEAEEGENLGLEMLPVPRHHSIAPVNIPDYYPEVIVLPMSRNPIFPRFVKMLEVIMS